MNDSAWFLMTTRDGMTAQLSSPRSERFPVEDLEGLPVAPAPAARRPFAPLLRRFRTAAA
jgi:hypothetical protein